VAALFDYRPRRGSHRRQQTSRVAESPTATQALDGQFHGGTIADAVDEERTLAERIQRAIDQGGELHQKPLFVVKKALIPAFDFLITPSSSTTTRTAD